MSKLIEVSAVMGQLLRFSVEHKSILAPTYFETQPFERINTIESIVANITRDLESLD